MHREKLAISYFVILVYTFIGLSHGKDDVQEDKSEELENKIDRTLNMIPDEKVFTHYVNDSRMVTCVGNDVYWMSNDNHVVSKDKKERIHVEYLSDSETKYPHLGLIFKEIQAVDNGEWTCTGNYEKKSFTMIVFVPIEFVPVDQLITVNELENKKLSCQADGKPKPEIQWMFNGTRINDSKVDENSFSKYIKLDDGLFINNVTREDMGDYTCKAYQISSKLSDQKEQIIQLNVLYEPEILYTTRVLRNGKLDSSSGIFFRYVYMNATLNLTCEANGNPLPDILWYHHGKKFSHKHVFNEPYFSTLTVHIHSNKSFGDYKCVAKNSEGKAEMPIRIKNGERPNKPEKFELLGKSNDTFNIKVESPNHADSSDVPFAITHYRFEIMRKDDYDSNGGNLKKQKISNEKARSNVSYIITNLMPNTTYLVRVASINDVGMSEFTDIKEFTTLVELPKNSKLNGDVRNLPAYGLVVFAIVLNILTVMN